MAIAETWHTIDLSHEEEKDIALPEIAAGSSKNPSWPLRSAPQTRYPQSHPLQPIPSADPIATDYKKSFLIRSTVSLRTPAPKPKKTSVFGLIWSKRQGIFVSLAILAVCTLITFSAAFAVAYHVDHNETDAQRNGP